MPKLSHGGWDQFRLWITVFLLLARSQQGAVVGVENLEECVHCQALSACSAQMGRRVHMRRWGSYPQRPWHYCEVGVTGDVGMLPREKPDLGGPSIARMDSQGVKCLVHRFFSLSSSSSSSSVFIAVTEHLIKVTWGREGWLWLPGLGDVVCPGSMVAREALTVVATRQQVTLCL